MISRGFCPRSKYQFLIGLVQSKPIIIVITRREIERIATLRNVIIQHPSCKHPDK
jgi:hypothetical protein